MKKIIIYCSLVFSIFAGCNQKKVTIVTYDLKRSDYLEAIDVTGTVQAVNNFVLVAPRVNASNLTVAHLAEEGAHVKKGDTICILDAPELTYNLETFNIDLEKLEADLKKLEADQAMQMALLKAQLETNKAQIAITMLDSVQLKFVPLVKQQLLSLEMEKSMVEKKKLQKKFAAQKRINESELIQMRSRIAMQKTRIQKFQNQANSLRLVAPCDGIVMHYVAPLMMFMGNGVGSIGGKIEEKSSVWSNMALLQFPDLKEMQVSVEVPEADYKRIEKDQKVMIQVEAASNLKTTGKVRRKSLAGKNSQEKPGIKTYEVIISIDSCHLSMKPELSASCRIIVNYVKDTIVIPAAAIFEKDSVKIVYVANDGKFKPVTIETGISNSSKSIITKGLTGNETIALMEPPFNLIGKTVKAKAAPKVNSPLSKKDSTINSSLIKR